MAATTLKAGDFAIIGYNGGSSDGTGRPATTDKIHFVLLRDIGSGTSIFFTDRTWTPTAGNSNLNAGAFSTSGTDGTYQYTAAMDLTAGTVITITAAQLSAAGVDYNHISGEAIYAYQGAANAPTAFLFALEAGDGNTTFNASLVNTGLTNGVNAVSVAYDSGAYSGPTTHAGAFLFNNSPLINSIADPTNWSGDNSTVESGGQNALEAQVQFGPWLVAPRIDIWGTAAGGGGAIVRTSGDQTVSSGVVNYNHAELYNKLLNGGTSVFWNVPDMVFDTVEGKFFVVDSDIGGGHNRILQGDIVDLLGNPGKVPALTVLYSDTGTTVASRLDSLEIDVANNIIYFTHGDNLEKIVFNTANQTPTVLFNANVALNPAGSTNNFFNDMVINFTTGSIYLSSARVGAAAGGDVVQKNFIYELTGLTTSSGTDAFQFNAGNTGTARLLPFIENDLAYNPNAGTVAAASPFSSAADPYAFAIERGTLDGLAIDPASNTLYFSTGAVLFDHDGDGNVADAIYTPGIIGRYALGANAANGQGAITVIHTQPGGVGSGLYGDLEIDVAAGKWYVTDYNGTSGSNEDSHIYQGNLAGGAPRQLFSTQIGNIEGLSTVGFTINHAPSLTGVAPGGAVTEASNAPASGNTGVTSLFSSILLDDVDTSTANELSGAVIRIATNFQSGATHQDFLRINGNTSGTLPSGISYTYNSSTGAMILSGQNTVAAYKAAIELVTFGTSGDDPTAFGTATTRNVAVAVSDGLSVSDEINAIVSVTGINDAPVNTLGAQAAGTEDVLTTAITGLSVADVDADPASASQKLYLNLSVAAGTLSILTNVSGGVVASDIVSGANNSASLTLFATQNAINATLAATNGVVLNTVANFNGTVALTMTSSDQGFSGTDPGLTGTGSQEVDIDTRVITINAVNDAPTFTDTTNLSSIGINEDLPSSTGQTVTDLLSVFGGSRFSDALDQQQTGSNPTGSVANTLAGIAIISNASSVSTGQWQYFDGATWIDIGTASVSAAKLITASTAIRFNPALNYNGVQPTLTLALIDSSGAAFTSGSTADVTIRGNSTRYSSDTAVIVGTITAVNDPPVNSVPAAQTILEDGSRVFNAANGNLISISDVDAGGGILNMVLGISGGIGGTLTLSGTTGLTFTQGDGAADGAMQFSGTAAAINAALNGLTFIASPNSNGSGVISIQTGDNGQTPGPNQFDVDTITVNITPVNDAPITTSAQPVAAAVIFEDTPTVGLTQTIGSLFADRLFDGIDQQFSSSNNPTGSVANTLAGVAITANGSGASGRWQYHDGSNWVDVGAASVTSAVLLAADAPVRFNPAANFFGLAPTLTVVLVDSSGGALASGSTANVTTRGGTTRYTIDTNTVTQDVTAVNDAPAFAASGAQPSFTENGSQVRIASGVTLSDVDNANFAGGTLTVTITNGATAGDGLFLPTSGAVSFGASPFNVVVDGVVIGAWSSLPGSVTISLNASATSARVIQLTEAIGFVTASDNPTATPRIVTFTLVDGGGTANLGSDTAGFTRTVTVVPTDDAPVAVADAASTAENAVLTGTVAGNTTVTFNDTDVDGGPKTVATVNGVGGNVGTQVTLASGALLTVNADGSYSYNPNGRFDYLVAPGSATGGQSSATDSFTYALNGGSSATVTITITGVDGAGDQIRGSAGPETLSGTPGVDYFNISQGGADTVNAGDGNDTIFTGSGFSADDVIDGGLGTDQISLRGSYTGSLGNVTNTEFMVFLSGNSTRFGGDGTARYSYDVTTTDVTVASGVQYIVQANELLATENLRFDGSAETNGSFVIYAGQGVDTLTGGAGNDGFFFGEGGRFTAADTVNGGAGSADQLGLRGNYGTAITFTATTMTGIETIVLLSSSTVPAGFRDAGNYAYNLVLNDANVGAFQTLRINAAQLGALETATVNGSAETDGSFFFIGGAGNDSFTGGAGDDIFFGGLKGDGLYGQGGNDTFRYSAVEESRGGERDFISQFDAGDRIDLSLIDAIVGGSDDAFTFIGAASFSNTAGELRATVVAPGFYLIEGDIDGVGGADFAISVGVAGGHVIAAADFIL